MEPHGSERQAMTYLRRFHVRLVLLGVVAAVVAAIAAGLAFARARTAPIGTGVVVIETNLAYEGAQAAGTGMVLTSLGEVLTNNHVIRGATTIKIVVPGTAHSYTAKVVGYDVTDDVAVLKATGASSLKTVSLGNSAAVKVGQAVKAVGNAGGSGTLTSSTGTVTAVSRAITVSDDQGDSEQLAGLIETNASLEPGDSGGPLFNAAGKVIGMDTAASAVYGFRQEASSSDGFAIPITKALTIVKRIESGKSTATVHVGGTAFLGVSVGTNSAYGSGAVIANVVSGGAASNAGLVPGDVITSLDGHAISSATSLGTVILAEKPGRKVTVTYLDETGTSQTTTVTLASGPPQ